MEASQAASVFRSVPVRMRLPVFNSLSRQCKPSTRTTGAVGWPGMVADDVRVGEQVELAFLDAVFHLAAGAIEIFVEAAWWSIARCFPCAMAGHHETRIGTVGQVLGPTTRRGRLQEVSVW